ncbi:DUF4369 domain-containing protein [Pedobacter sp.]|jgi:hypothetical protein|uniref:DUF4369 domain-containing protein n=1 Tax=Pedobacter sp. TaxID=1411316 RepID=UPI002C831107|nr:DUF4369 domain-containing protein [Pedobacter sp.]HWW40701.1 DUF4369 domain-containing protein [Pedobacter sp.]
MTHLLICMLLLAALLLAAAKAPLKLFLLTGTVRGRNGQRVSLVENRMEQSGQVLSTVMIQNDQFRLSCNVEQKTTVYLVFHEEKERKSYPLMLKEGHFNFCADEGILNG